MTLLKDTIAREMIRLDNMEHKARTLLSEQDSLDIRLHRAFEAVWLEALVASFNMERKRILEEEERGEFSNTLAGFGVLGAMFAGGALLPLLTRQKTNWDRVASAAFPAAFPEESFGDIRVEIASHKMPELVNISQIARERSMTVTQAVAYLEEKGNQVLSWQEFEAGVRNLRRAVLNGEPLALEEALEYIDK